MESIAIVVETVDWTMGENGHFVLAVREGSRALIEWGDGHCQTVTGTGEEQRFEHDYKRRLPIRSFHVSVTAEEEGSILSYSHGFIDMRTLSVSVKGCTAMRKVNVSRAGTADIQSCPCLESAECGGDAVKSVSVRDCGRLEKLALRFTKLKALDLTPCPSVRELDCTGCHGLEKISLGNGSRLTRVILEPEVAGRLSPSSLRFIESVTERNGGGIELVKPHIDEE